jgi:hypothetical protein
MVYWMPGLYFGESWTGVPGIGRTLLGWNGPWLDEGSRPGKFEAPPGTGGTGVNGGVVPFGSGCPTVGKKGLAPENGNTPCVATGEPGCTGGSNGTVVVGRFIIMSSMGRSIGFPSPVIEPKRLDWVP